MALPTPRQRGAAVGAFTSPEQIVFIGDNPIADIDGAKRFGMKAAWIRRGRQHPVDPQPPDHIINLVTEVRNIVSVTYTFGP